MAERPGNPTTRSFDPKSGSFSTGLGYPITPHCISYFLERRTRVRNEREETYRRKG
jgi:hypothetical protein